MGSAYTIAQQILTMFIYLGLGCILFKKKLVSKEGSVCFAHVLIYLILPCAILQSFFTERTPQKMTSLVLSMFWGLVILLVAMLIAALIFRKHPIDHFGAAFSNAGFMGLPLITDMLGQESVFYVAGMIAFLNILQWYYGQSVLSGKKIPLSLSRILKNPLVLSLFVGLGCFFLNVNPPVVVQKCVSSIAAMNGPVAMIVLGFYLAQTDVKSLFGKIGTYWVSIVRLLIIPLVTLVILFVIPDLDVTIKLALLLAASAPIGANVAVYAQTLDKDYVYAVETVCLSTLFSILTIPMMIALAENVLI